jgi:hypothetical protein
MGCRLVSSVIPETEIGGSGLKASPGKVITRPYQKNKLQAKRTEDKAQVEKHLPSKLQAPISARKKKKKSKTK